MTLRFCHMHPASANNAPHTLVKSPHALCSSFPYTIHCTGIDWGTLRLALQSDLRRRTVQGFLYNSEANESARTLTVSKG